MDPKEIEALIGECQEDSSEASFNLDKGHVMVVNKDKYIVSLEQLIRAYFTKIE